MSEAARQRTLYPALRLWRAEVGAGHAGQALEDPGTWNRDALWRAAWFEIEAMALAERGDQEGARQEIQRARLAMLEDDPHQRDSDYRSALAARAERHLGTAAAAALSLRGRPRNRGGI